MSLFQYRRMSCNQPTADVSDANLLGLDGDVILRYILPSFESIFSIFCFVASAASHSAVYSCTFPAPHRPLHMSFNYLVGILQRYQWFKPGWRNIRYQSIGKVLVDARPPGRFRNRFSHNLFTQPSWNIPFWILSHLGRSPR